MKRAPINEEMFDLIVDGAPPPARWLPRRLRVAMARWFFRGVGE
jgi:hypothetical protein